MRNMRLLLFGVIAAALLTAQVATAPTTGNGGQTSVQANPTLGSGGGARSGDASRPFYFAGKVVLDRSPVTQNVAIERVCGGIAKTVAYTDSHGPFNCQCVDH